jgi:hypothetical protein
MSNVELKDFESAVKVLVAGGSKIKGSVIHSTKLHMVYGVPVVDCVKGSGAGCAGATDDINRNSVYSFKARVEKAIEFIKD